MSNEYKLEHGGTMRPATEEEQLDLNAVIIDVTVFRPDGTYQDTISFILENMERQKVSVMRRISKDKTEYFHIYEDVLKAVRNRTFYKDMVVTVNCTEYYPTLIYPDSISNKIKEIFE
jgi:hypothetical protein